MRSPRTAPTQGGSYKSCIPCIFCVSRRFQEQRLPRRKPAEKSGHHCITIPPAFVSNGMCKLEAPPRNGGGHHGTTILRVSRGLLDTQFAGAIERPGQGLRDGRAFLIRHRRIGLSVREGPAIFQNAKRTSSLERKTSTTVSSSRLRFPHAAEAPKCVFPSVFSFSSRRNSHSSEIRLPAHQ